MSPKMQCHKPKVKKMKKPNLICNLVKKKFKANPKKDHGTKRQP